MFLARGLTFTDTDRDEDEFLEVFRMPLSDAVRSVLNGEIPDGKTQCAVLRAAAAVGLALLAIIECFRRAFRRHRRRRMKL